MKLLKLKIFLLKNLIKKKIIANKKKNKIFFFLLKNVKIKKNFRIYTYLFIWKSGLKNLKYEKI